MLARELKIRYCYKCGIRTSDHGPGMCGTKIERVTSPAHSVTVSFLKTLMMLPVLFTAADLEAVGVSRTMIWRELNALADIGWFRAEEKVLTPKGKRMTLWRRLISLKETA